MTGTLYVVATPIGNLEDITLRALNTLNEADAIACEDTRVTARLLARYEIRKPLISYHEHNEEKRTPELIELLKSGKDVALVSDAGTPGVSDPGVRLVKAASKSGIRVTPIPGAAAVIAAPSVSALPCSRFAFLGFAERGRKKKRDFFHAIRNYPETLVFYESPRRALATLKTILEVLGDREAALCRELTKMHEETLRGRVSEIIEELGSREKIKGEITIVIQGAKDRFWSQDSLREMLRSKKRLGKTLRESVDEICESTQAHRNEVYDLALEIWNERGG